MDVFLARLPNLITVLLGIFLEASPFLLIGVLISSVLDVALASRRLGRNLPRNGAFALLGGVAAGAAAPLCECGTVPIARGSVSRGVPIPGVVGFLLAAPVINPITVAATYTAFRYDTSMVALRIGCGVAIALLVGTLFMFWPATSSPLRKGAGSAVNQHDAEGSSLVHILVHAGNELRSLMVYLVGSSLVAALLQVFLPRTQLLSLGQGLLLSILVMLVIAVALSTCSSVDAFVALAFSTTFAPGAILAFLLISPVLNLKSVSLLAVLFRPRVTISLLSTATLTALVAAVAVNYHLL